MKNALAYARVSNEIKEKLRKKLAYFAKKHLGKPYECEAKPWEAPKVFDCSSFTQYLYKRIGIDLPRTAIEQAHLGKEIEPRKEKLVVGDAPYSIKHIPNCGHRVRLEEPALVNKHILEFLKS